MAKVEGYAKVKVDRQEADKQLEVLESKACTSSSKVELLSSKAKV